MTKTPARPLTVLLVEDNATDAKLVRIVLQEQGYRVKLATSAEDAMESLHQELPDVILSDLVLPRRSGVELRREVLASQRTAHIPMIAMSAHVEAYTRGAVLGESFAAYLQKPLDTRTLAEEVGRQIR